MARDTMDDSASKDHAYTMEEVPNEKSSLAGLPGHLHQAMRAGLSQEDAEFLYSVDKAEQKKIFHKVDWRLCPMLAILYLISHLDRANIGLETSLCSSKHIKLPLTFTQKQRQDRRPRENSGYERHRLQCCAHGLLRPICPLRDPFQHDSRKVQTPIVLHGYADAVLGYRYDSHGTGTKSCGSLRYEVLPWFI